MKERKQKELSSLFVKPVSRAEIVRPSSEKFKRAKKEHQKLEKLIEKSEHDQEELEAPIHRAKLEAQGITAQQSIEILAHRDRINRSLSDEIRKMGIEHTGYVLPTSIEDSPSQTLSQPSSQISFQTLSQPSSCTDINIRVCKERVCVDQSIAMNVNDIWLSGGSDTSLTKPSQNSFKAEDSVAGYSKWNAEYHRYSQIHEGEINILASIELTESSLVKGLGMIFSHLLDPNGFREWNGYWAGGYYPFALPASYGYVKMWLDLNIRYKKPGEVEKIWFDLPKILYVDYGPVAVRVAAHCDMIIGEWVPENASRNLFVDRYSHFPAGTQFTTHVLLSYWIKGRGGGGQAAVGYGNVVYPYINMESCSYEYPDHITIHVPSYLP